MGKVIAFCNQKGGVGKTTSVVNVGAILADTGYKVLLIDMDSQANATSGLGVDKPAIEFTTYQLIVDKSANDTLIKKTSFNNLEIIPSSSELSGAELEIINMERREYALKEKLNNFKNKFDFILIDCPPSLGLITINCLAASDCIIIPLQCEYYALEGLAQLIHTYQLVKGKINPEIEIGGVILTMADLRTNLTQQVIEEVKKYFKEKVFKAVIGRSVKVAEAPSFGKPVVFYDPTCKGSKSYYEITTEFIERFAEKKLTVNQPETGDAMTTEKLKDSIENDETITQNEQRERQEIQS